jgi:hypothetical protein
MSESALVPGRRPRHWGESPPWNFLRRLWGNHLAVTGFSLVFLVFLAAILAGVLSSYDPLTMVVSDRMKSPSMTHLMGTDNFGRDIFSRVLHGARLSLEVGAAVMLLTVGAGILFGLVSGYSPRLDGPVMRVMDAMMAFPAILFGIASCMRWPKTVNVVIALSVVYAPRTVRIVRSVWRPSSSITWSRPGGQRDTCGSCSTILQLSSPLGPGDLQLRLRRPGRGVAFLRRRGGAAADAKLGQHPERRADLHAECPLDHDLSGRGHCSYRHGLEPGGGRTAGYPGSEDEDVTSEPRTVEEVPSAKP